MLLQYLKKKYILILFHLMVLSSEGHRKSKKARDLKLSPPKYDIYTSDRLPSDVQVTKYLLKDEKNTFSYWSTQVNGTLSITIIPCTSRIQWNFKYIGDNSTDYSEGADGTFLINRFHTKSFISKQGVYSLSLLAIDSETYIHLYISTEIEGPQALRASHTDNFRIYEKDKRKSVSLKWSPSLVDPQSTNYCLVISTKKNYDSLCAAQASRFELPPPSNRKVQKPPSASQIVTKWEIPSNKYFDQVDPMIACTGKKTQYTLSNLKEGQIYYYDLFAINKQSNLTYPYGSSSTVFRSRTKPISLRNGFGRANLKRFGEKAVFRYKIGRDIKDNLDLLVIPCGGPINVKVMLKNETLLTARKIEGFRKLTVKDPKIGARYLIKVLSYTRDDLRRTSGVEVYASNKALSRIPLITQPKIEEYTSLKGCHSVTIGWMLVPEPTTLHYCIEVTEGKLRDMQDYKKPNQCGLENRLKKSVDFITKYCKDIKQDKNKKVVTHTIKELKPGRNYIVQVTVKKSRGKTLSYDILQVSTNKCGKH